VEHNPDETVDDFITRVGASMKPHVDGLSAKARMRIEAAQVEVQRSLIGFNGAGLVAVISLLKASIGSLYVHLSVWMFFAGMICGVASWVFDSRQAYVVANIDGLIAKMRKSLFDSGTAQLKVSEVIKTPADAEAAMAAYRRVAKHVTDSLTRMGRPQNIAAIGACAFFTAGLFTLVGGFQFAPVAPQATDCVRVERATSKPLAEPPAVAKPLAR
jgi:hypothetical protein